MIVRQHPSKGSWRYGVAIVACAHYAYRTKSNAYRERIFLVPTLYLTEDHAMVRRDSENCLLVHIPERREEDGSTVIPAQKRRIPLIKVDDVVVMGDITLTTAAIHLLLEKNVEIHFLNAYGSFKGRLSPGLSKNALLRLKQHQMHHEIGQRCRLAKRFVIGKLSNQRMLLQRHNRRQEHP